MALEEVSSSDFEEKVLNSKTPVVVDFWAEWCGPCRFYSPIIEEISKEFSKAKFMSVNTDENPDIATTYGIMSIPTTMIFQDGKPKAGMVGAVPKETLKKWLSQNI
ncbi:MAG: thioredoxin [Candidatus Micrarchaeia archaeon]